MCVSEHHGVRWSVLYVCTHVVSRVSREVPLLTLAAASSVIYSQDHEVTMYCHTLNCRVTAYLFLVAYSKIRP